MIALDLVTRIKNDLFCLILFYSKDWGVLSCSAHLIFVDLIILMILGKKVK
jgi:hypothetical protein